MRQTVFEISHFKVWNLSKSPFCRCLALFSLENEVTDAILQSNEKMKVQYLRSLLIDLLEILQDVRPYKKIHLISNSVAMATKIKMIVYY